MVFKLNFLQTRAGYVSGMRKERDSGKAFLISVKSRRCPGYYPVPVAYGETACCCPL